MWKSNPGYLLLLFVLTSAVPKAPCQAEEVREAPGLPRLNVNNGASVLELEISGFSEPGSLIILHADEVTELNESASVLLEREVQAEEWVRLSLEGQAESSSRGFFRAGFWPGWVLEDPSAIEETAWPEMLLVTAMDSEGMQTGAPMEVDFVIIEPEGSVLDVSGPVRLHLVHERAGSIHPDAVISPSQGFMREGHLRIELMIQASSTLENYVFALSPVEEQLAQRLGIAPSKVNNLNQFLKTVFSIQGPISAPVKQEKLQEMENRREAAADDGPWHYPMDSEKLHNVSGTFGEWRGHNGDIHVHRGLDLSASQQLNRQVRASRGGVVSWHSTLSQNRGDYIVLDHGNGWFSRYLHLASIKIRNGQRVEAGDVLSDKLHDMPGAHLHFEIRHDPATVARWGVPEPGGAIDPLLVENGFRVKAGQVNPKIEKLGITRKHPGQHRFLKPDGDEEAEQDSPVYVVCRILDIEWGNRLTLRSAKFSAEGIDGELEIAPGNDAAIEMLVPKAGNLDKDAGFALYSEKHGTGQIDHSERRKFFYRHWWKWGTGAYASSPNGPRWFRIEGEDYSGGNLDYTFHFGPKVESEPVRIGPATYQFTLLPHLGRKSANDDHIQPDQYELSIRDSDGKIVDGVLWWEDETEFSGAVARSSVQRQHLKALTCKFQLPAGFLSSIATVHARSVLVPDISHEVQFETGMIVVVVQVNSFAGTAWDGVEAPLMVRGATHSGETSLIFMGSNGKFERGNPLFSSFVDAGNRFHALNLVVGFPSRPGGPFVNRLGGSSFLAFSNHGNEFWVNLSAGAWRISGGVVSDWEYQLRYYSGDGTEERPESLLIGTVPNSGIFIGQEVADFSVRLE